MPRTPAPKRSLMVVASFLNGSSRQRRAQLSQSRRSLAACSALFVRSGVRIDLAPPDGHVGRLKCSLPTCPPGSTTTKDCECWVPHETTRDPSASLERGFPQYKARLHW